MNAVVESLPATEASLPALPRARGWIDGEARRGAMAMLAAIVGFIPFGVLVGVAVAGSVQPASAWASVWPIFSGSAHLTVIQLVNSGAGVFAAAATGLLVNARLLLFSATLAPHWRGTSIWTRLVAAATVIDPTWMVAAPRFARTPDPAAGRRYYYGASSVLWVGWGAAVTIGALAGAVIPAGAGLDLLAPLALMSVISARLRTAPGAACVALAALVAAVCVRLPGGAGLIVSVIAGTAAATIVRRLREKRQLR